MSNAKIDKALLEKLAKATEKQLGDFPRLCPRSMRELNAITKALASRKHTYGTCVHAIALAAEAAYNFISHKLGVTGFQASCADIQILSRSRSMKHGCRIIDYGALLYPQYNDEFRINLSAEQFAHIRKAARAKLDDKGSAHPDVAAHWAYVAYGGHPFGLDVEEEESQETSAEAPESVVEASESPKKKVKRKCKKKVKRKCKISFPETRVSRKILLTKRPQRL